MASSNYPHDRYYGDSRGQREAGPQGNYDLGSGRRSGGFSRDGEGYGQGLSDQGGGRDYPRYGRNDWNQQDLDYYARDFEDRGYGDRGYTPYSPYSSYNPRGRSMAGNAYRERDYGRDQNRGNDRDFWDRASDEVASWFGDSDAETRRQMDSHRGKGPKGYRRSDSRIEEDVSDRLSDDMSLDASDIEIVVKDGEVTLKGVVAGRWEKRRAEDCAESVSGVVNVQNNLRVRQAETTAGMSGSSGRSSHAVTSGETSVPGTTGLSGSPSRSVSSSSFGTSDKSTNS